MINIFIDAQIWLSIYTFSKDNLKQFSKLKKLIKNKEVSILLTEQVRYEVFRNRENKLKDVLKQTAELSFNIPVLYQGYEKELDQFSKLFNETQKLNKEIQEKIRKDIIEQTLPQDKLINELFEVSNLLETTTSLIDKAILRYRIIGNPPGKDNKCGDSINWETLLEQFPDKQDLFIISDDKDYKSVLDENNLNQFLKNEWVKAKNSNIYFYKSLTDFFSKHLTDIKIVTNKQQDELIEALNYSGTFSTTHSIISKMSIYPNWTTDQVFKIASIVRENSQILYILHDDDVYTFMLDLINNIEKTDNEDVLFLKNELWNKN